MGAKKTARANGQHHQVWINLRLKSKRVNEIPTTLIRLLLLIPDTISKWPLRSMLKAMVAISIPAKQYFFISRAAINKDLFPIFLRFQ